MHKLRPPCPRAFGRPLLLALLLLLLAGCRLTAAEAGADNDLWKKPVVFISMTKRATLCHCFLLTWNFAWGHSCNPESCVRGKYGERDSLKWPR